MPSITAIEVLFIVIALMLALLVASRADLTRARGGKILAFIALFLAPSLALWVGYSMQMEGAKSTQFCLSCHVMTAYGKSLYMDNQSYLAAAHFENGRIPRDEACYTCHTFYTLFGGIKAKWHGLHHVYKEYLGEYSGKAPEPEKIKLYDPFNNRECLHCHAHSRSYVENKSHHEDPNTLPLVSANRLSCMTSKCHDVVHDVADQKDPNATFWKESQ